MYREQLGEKLKNERKNAGYTQQQIASFLKIPQNNISRYENGEREPDIETLGTLADFYEVSIDWLLGRGTKRK